MTKYVCDMCDKTISGPDIALIIRADSLTFCNDACSQSWLDAEIKKEEGEAKNTKVLRQDRPLDGWGGARTPGPGKTMGPDPMPEDQKRQMASARFAPGTVELAKAIAKIKGYPGWSRVIDEAIVHLVEQDPILKRDLAEMGIIVKVWQSE